MGRCRETYLVWNIGRNAIYKDEEEDDWVEEVGEDVVEDDEESGEVVGEDGGVKVGGGEWESGGDLSFQKRFYY